MKTTSSPIVQALAQLELERANLAVRLEKVDALIASMREVFHLPHRPAPVTRTVRLAPAPSGMAAARVSADAIRAALQGGPLSPGVLTERLGISRYTLQQFEKQGVIVSTGTTASRRVALPGRSAKEAP